MPEVLLASGSPRRVELLSRLIPEFKRASSDVEETGSNLAPSFNLDPFDLPAGFNVGAGYDPRLWAWRKAVDVSGLSRLDGIQGSLFLGADTVVVSRGRVLGKPKSRDEAAEMLRLLRGTDHYVLTGLSLLHKVKMTLDICAITACATRVVMKDFSDAELAGYVATDEPMDKAGAYAVQGEGSKLIARVEGCYTNVVGMPLCIVRAMLTTADVQLLPYPCGGYCQSCISVVSDIERS